MPSINIKNRRLIILGLIFLASLSALIGKPEGVLMIAGGLLALLKDDKEEGE